jgi:hypothetical protein
VEKFCFSLYYASTKFRRYILSSSCIVACQYDVIKHMLLKPILCGRMGKWAYALVGYDLAYKPLQLMKGQVVVDFIVDRATYVDHSVNFVQLKPWGLYFDGSICSKGQGAGFVVVSPSGVYIDLSIRLEFACTNNQVEYESLLHALEFLRDLGARKRMRLRYSIKACRSMCILEREREHIGSIWSRVTCLALLLVAAQSLERRAPGDSRSLQRLTVVIRNK